MRGVRRTVAFGHLLQIAVVRGNAHTAAKGQHLAYNASGTVINLFHSGNRSAEHTGMTNHIRICKVQDNRIKFILIQLCQ